jgi:ribosome-binding protein aMBF1 (putative translation factor)
LEGRTSSLALPSAFGARDSTSIALAAHAAERRRTLLRTLADQRKRHNLSQTRVAAEMRTSQPTLARLERTAADAKLSTVERFADALGYSLEYHLVPTKKSKRKTGVVVET